MASASGIGRYRAGVAKLLAGSIARSGEIERWQDAEVDGGEASKRVVLESDPTGALQIMCALLLRKARLHAIAVLRANATCNVHSLAVQMRPALECAGQVMLIFHNTLIAPDGGDGVVGGYLNADFYGTIIRVTKGEVGHKQLLKMISSASGEPEGTRRGGRLRQADKVEMLEGGKDWYDYLSEYFCHGNGNLRGSSWQGGVVSTSTARDEFACAGMMDYLVNQMAVMNAYATLCPLAGKVVDERAEAGLGQLEEVRTACKALRDGVELLAECVEKNGPG